MQLTFTCVQSPPQETMKPETLPTEDTWYSLQCRNAALRNLLPCFGSLVVRTIHASGEWNRVAVCSGFFLEHLGIHFWMTAGHVLDEILNTMKDPNTRIREMLLRDGLPIVHEDAASIPFKLEPSQVFSIDLDGPAGVDGTGLDFGMVPIEKETLALLQANPGVGFVNAEDSLDSLQADAWGLYLMGVPGERAQRASETNLQYQIHCLAVKVLGECPNGLARCQRAIYGELVGDQHIDAQPESIRGMSGGPVFAIEPRGGGNWRCRLVGILSAWHAPSRTVRITPIADVLVSVEHAVITAMRKRYTQPDAGRSDC